MTIRCRGEEFWRKTIEAYKESKLSVAEFCTQQQLSSVTFYKWRKRLKHPEPPFDDLPAVATKYSRANAKAQQSTAKRTNGSLMELVLCDSSASSGSTTSPKSQAATRPQMIELSLAGGTLVRIHGSIDTDSVGSLLAAIQSASPVVEVHGHAGDQL